MSNTFGTSFRVTTFGESHGPALGAVIDGCPAGVPVDDEAIGAALMRDIAFEAVATERREPNAFEILSGVLDGVTLGTPLAIVISNQDARKDGYGDRRGVPRPGHAELTWTARYGLFDWQGGGRASGRECIARVAAGAIGRQILETCGIAISTRLVEIAGVPIACDADRDRALARAKEIASGGDSSGGIFDLEITGVPAGLGAPVFGKLKSDLPAAILSIGAVVFAALGDGLNAPSFVGSAWNDAILSRDGVLGTETNRCGGMFGGLATGEPVRVRVGVKPPPSVEIPQRTVDLATGRPTDVTSRGRFDTNVTPRVAVVAEAMAALVLVDHLLQAGHIHPTRFALSPLLTQRGHTPRGG